MLADQWRAGGSMQGLPSVEEPQVIPGIACFTVDAAAGDQDTHNDQIFYVNSKEMNPD